MALWQRHGVEGAAPAWSGKTAGALRTGGGLSNDGSGTRLVHAWCRRRGRADEFEGDADRSPSESRRLSQRSGRAVGTGTWWLPDARRDRKSTRLNSSHLGISYAV